MTLSVTICFILTAISGIMKSHRINHLEDKIKCHIHYIYTDETSEPYFPRREE